jgi:predicted phosphodiesterase
MVAVTPSPPSPQIKRKVDLTRWYLNPGSLTQPRGGTMSSVGHQQTVYFELLFV